MERFWSKVAKSDGCWLWLGATYRNRHGQNTYGQFRIGNKMKAAHRVSYELKNGTIPTGKCVLHSCDVPACVNPDHLRLGSYSENMADMDARGRRVRTNGEINGCSKLTTDDVHSIRKQHAKGGKQKDIAEYYEVSKATISLIVNYKRWTHVVQ